MVNTKSILSLLAGVAVGGTIAIVPSAPAHAIFVVNPGGGYTANTSTDFNFDFSGSGLPTTLSPANPISLNITALFANNDLSDTEAYLIAPGGGANKTLELWFPFSLNGFAMTDTVLTDAGSPVISAVNTGSNPSYTGSFQPTGSGGFSLTANLTNFAAFNGSDPNGIWTLRIYDTNPTGGGTLGPVQLDVVPFEFSPTTGLLTLGALFGLDRLRRKITIKKN